MPMSKPARKGSIKQIEPNTLVKLLARYYPDAHCALDYKNPEQLLIATILSAQCTDERVNQVTKILFQEYPDLPALAKATAKQIETIIRSTGFYKNKAKNIKATAQFLTKNYDGKVPPDLDVLVQLPGVGRKTANVVMGNSFQIPTGVVVDTHVGRLSRRMGLTKEADPKKVEMVLQKKIEKKNWIMFSHWLIWHGRKVCKARKPQCQTCFLDDLCPKRL